MGKGSSELRGLRQEVEELALEVYRVGSVAGELRDSLKQTMVHVRDLRQRIGALEDAMKNPSGASPTEVKKRVTRRVAAAKKGKK